MRQVWLTVAFLLGGAVSAGAGEETVDQAVALYRTHCAECHGADRLGGSGPALLPENLGRLKPAAAVQVIAEGRPATQMQGFRDKLDAAQIEALAKLVYQPLAAVPPWDLAQIEASRVVSLTPADLPAQPVHQAEPMNLFVVVELGDHHATILDGDRLEPIHRFATRFALHGGPKFTPDGRFVYFCSRDGWVTKFDLHSLRVVAEARAGINARNLAVSGDGKRVMVANYLPHTLTVLDALDLKPLQVIPTVDPATGKSSRVSAVYAAPPRNAFVAALKDLPEVWEIPYHGPAEAPLPVRRIGVSDFLDDFFFDQSYTHLIGASRDGGRAQVVDLDQGRPTATVEIPGMPHLGSGITWERQGTTVLATPNLKEGAVSVIDLANWQVIKRIPTLGPGFFIRSHEQSRYAWVDNFFAKASDTVMVIDKETLEVVKTLQPAPGKVAAHVEFTRDGRYALLSIWDNDGAVVVYDARTLEEVKRLPMRKPSGKYNVFNKVTRSSGTSH